MGEQVVVAAWPVQHAGDGSKAQPAVFRIETPRLGPPLNWPLLRSCVVKYPYRQRVEPVQ